MNANLRRVAWIAAVLFCTMGPAGVLAVEPSINEPRTAEEVLKSLRSLTEPVMPSANPGEAELERYKAEFTAYHRRVASLTSKLDAYAGEVSDLPNWMERRVRSLRALATATEDPAAEWENELRLTIARHPGTRAAAQAELALMERVVVDLSLAGLSLSDQSLTRLAEVEKQAVDPADPFMAGGLLEYAADQRGPNTLAHWQDWMINNLPPGSYARGAAVSANMFGKPLRLAGEGIDGITIDTADWAGDVILVDFWGTWCGPCIAGMPEVARLRDEFASQGFRVLGVAFDSPERVRDFLADRAEFTWPHIAGVDRPGRPVPYDNPIVTEYGVSSFPTYWLIDRNGLVHKAPHPRSGLRDRVAELLADPRP